MTSSLPDDGVPTSLTLRVDGIIQTAVVQAFNGQLCAQRGSAHIYKDDVNKGWASITKHRCTFRARKCVRLRTLAHTKGASKFGDGCPSLVHIILTDVSGAPLCTELSSECLYNSSLHQNLF